MAGMGVVVVVLLCVTQEEMYVLRCTGGSNRGILLQSCQSVPELDTGSHLAEIQLFLGDLNHFHIAELTMGWGKISPNAGDAKPFGNPEAAT